MIEIGRLCVKTAGRDAGKKCVIVDILDDRFVLIDGETRRRKCNILHLEPLKEVIEVKKNASHENIKEEFGKLGLKARETKPKEKKEKPARQKKDKLKKEPKKKKDEAKKKLKKEGETEESGIEGKISEEAEKNKPKRPAKTAVKGKK